MLASAIPGFSQVVAPGSDGLLVPPKKPQAWAQAIETLLDDASLRSAMGQAGLRKARLYDWGHVVDEVLDVYGEARLRASAHQVASDVHSQVPGLG